MTEQEEIGPNKIPFTTFLLKLISAGVGGGVGSLILLLIFFVASSMLTPLTNAADNYISPIFVFILLMMIFLSTTVGNIISTWLLALTEPHKYKRIPSTIYQVFIISLIIFILMAPIYFVTAVSGVELIAYAVALHIILSAQVSSLILEIISNIKHALVGVYGVTFSILLSAGLMFGFSSIVEAPQILLFVALPIVWLSIALVGSLTTIIYGWIARIYDKDFLSTQTVYGDDYGKDIEEIEKKLHPKAEDEAGADFLRHN